MQTTNNTTNLGSNDLQGLTGEELKRALAKKLAEIEQAAQDVYDKTDPTAKESELLEDRDDKKERQEDLAFVEQAEEDLERDLDDAVLDLATTDKTLEVIEQGETEE